MGLLNPMFESVFLKSAVLLAIAANSGIVPRKLVAAQTAAANKVEAKVQPGGGRGEFISFKKGTLNHRLVGELVSYEAGKLNLVAIDAPPGYVNKAADSFSLLIDPSTPVLESIDGGDLKFAGLAREVLKNVKPGARIITRSEYDADAIDVIEVGEPKRRMERYIGQSRGPIRGTFVSFKDRVLRIQGKGVNLLATNEYDRLIAWRIIDGIPIFESVDGGAYQPADIKSLESAKEGTIVTIRKIEDVIIDVKIGVAK